MDAFPPSGDDAEYENVSTGRLPTLEVVKALVEEGTFEVPWWLVVRGEALEGRYAPRGGAFVDLAEAISSTEDCRPIAATPCP